MTVQLVRVEPSQVNVVLWGFVEPYIARAFESGIGDDTAIIVADDIFKGRSRLWIALLEKQILGVATTKIIDTATKRLCVITSGAGIDLHKWRHFIADIERYAAQNGCHAVRMMGRPGWKRVFRDYREPWVCLEKQLKD